MPICPDNELATLLAEGRVTAITLDTNTFDSKKLSLKSPAFKAIAALKEIPFSFLLSETVLKEVQSHLGKLVEDSLRVTKKAVGQTLHAFEVETPTRDEILEQLTGGRSPKDAATEILGTFVKDSKCEIVDDKSLVDVETLFSAYFQKLPPFSSGKKAEFPDALALYSLDKAATAKQTGFIVVSKDGDWRSFCEQSDKLYLVPEIEKALALITNAPVNLRRSIVAWLSDDAVGRSELLPEISNFVVDMDTEVNACATSGEVEAFAWGAEVRSIAWPDDKDIDIIELEDIAEACIRVVVSFPLIISVLVNVELSFSIWDSIDKESLAMGGRSIEVLHDQEAQATITLDVCSPGSAGEKIEFVEIELDGQFMYVDLGDVDVFEPGDYDPE